MSDGSDPFGFGKFIPGFEFLQSLAQGAKAAAGAGADAPLSGMAQWVAPTVSVEEIDKRLQELRAVQFWLEQNGRALSATIQALEVQKMTLAALKSMPGGLNEWASSFKTPDPAAEPAAQPHPGAAAVDPLKWWGALTQQFQQIATQVLQEPAAQQAMQAGGQMAEEFARSAMHHASDLTQAAAPGAGSSSAKPQTKPAAAVAKKSTQKKPAAATAKAAAKKPASRRQG